MSQKPIWITHLNLEELCLRSENSLSSHLGIRFTEVGNRHLTATMAVDEKAIQPMGILHGGASCALAETVGSAAANYCVNQKTHICLGLDLNINHIRTVPKGQIIKAIAEPFHIGRRTQVWEIKIYNEKMEIVSVARLTMAVIEKENARN